jgi:hypothetical protein
MFNIERELQMKLVEIDSLMKLSGANLDFILAIGEYLKLHQTSLQHFIEWKDHEDLYSMQEHKEH